MGLEFRVFPKGYLAVLDGFVRWAAPDQRFRRKREGTGAGYVKRKDGDYARAKGNGCEPLAALIESFGGFSPELMGLLKRAAEQRMNRLTHYEYDQTSVPHDSLPELTPKALS